MVSQRVEIGVIDSRAFDALVRCCQDHCHESSAEAGTASRDLGVDDLRPAMVIVDDIFTSEGALLVGRGTVVTDTLITRLENYIEQGRVTDAIRVQG